MNRIYILGEVLNVSDMHFDYYNKLKAHFKFSILDMYDNVFECVVLEKKYKRRDIKGKLGLEDAFSLVKERHINDKGIYVICALESGKYIVVDMF